MVEFVELVGTMNDDMRDNAPMVHRIHDGSSSNKKSLLYLLTGLSAIGGFLFGYDTGVVSGAMLLLKEDFSLDSMWQELIVSVTVGFAAIFSLFGSPLNNRFGRKFVILLSSLIFVAGSVLMAAAPDKYVLLAGRATVGAAIGLSSMTIPMYIAESSPPDIRGKLVTVNILFVTGGQVIASCVDGLFSGNKVNGWRYMLGLAAVPAVIQFFGFLFLPESPRWLVQKGKISKAASVLRSMLGSEAKVQNEIESLVRTFEEQGRAKSNFCRILTQKSTRRALVVGCGMQMFQQLAGINTVMYYSATIIQMSGIRDDTTAIWLAAAVASVNFIGTAIGICAVERLGRRALSLLSIGGVTLSLLFLSLSFFLPALDSPAVTQNMTNIDKDTFGCYKYSSCEPCMLSDHCGFCYMQFSNDSGVSDTYCLPSDPNNWHQSLVGQCSMSNATSSAGPFFAQNYCPTRYFLMPLLGMILYLLCFAPGLGPMPWTVNSEIYPQWARSTGNACSTGTNWVFNVVISLTFLDISQMLTYQGAFLLYAGFAFLGFCFMYFLLPETKGKPLEEVEALFMRGWIVRKTSGSEAYRVILNGNDTSDNDEDTLFSK